MKKLFALLTVFTLILTGCSSDSEGSETEIYLKFKVNGQNYNFDPETLTSMKKLVRGDQGGDNEYKSISLWMPEEVTEGTYSFSDTPSDLETFNASYSSAGEDIYIDATSGTITITSVTDDYVKGTFSFSGDNEGTTVNVTNGEFKAFY